VSCIILTRLLVHDHSALNAGAFFQFCVRFLGEHVASAALVIPPGNGCNMLARIRLKVFHWLGHVQQMGCMACLYFFGLAMSVCRYDYGNSELNLAIWQDDPIALKLPLRTRSDGGERSSRALMETDAPAGLPTTLVTTICRCELFCSDSGRT
jgi:hypothetical protein